MGTYHSYYTHRRPLLKLLIQNQDSKTKTFFECQAIIDTGATITCVSLAIAKKLGLKKWGEVNYLSASGKGKTFKARISIIFPLNLKYFSAKESTKVFSAPTEMALFKEEVMVMPLEKNADLLIGIDLISKGNFYINNNYFSFELP